MTLKPNEASRNGDQPQQLCLLNQKQLAALRRPSTFNPLREAELTASETDRARQARRPKDSASQEKLQDMLPGF